MREPWTPEETARFLHESKRLASKDVTRVHLTKDGHVEECTVVDPGPMRMGACIICGAVYLQEDRLRELQMFHNVGERRMVANLDETNRLLGKVEEAAEEWCKKHVACRGHKKCLPWYQRFWSWIRG